MTIADGIAVLALLAAAACWRSAWAANARVLRLAIAVSELAQAATQRAANLMPRRVPEGPCAAWITQDRHDPHLYEAPTDGTCWCPGWPIRTTEGEHRP